MRTLILLFIYTLLTILVTPLLLVCYLAKCAKPLLYVGKGALHLGQFILGIHLEVLGHERIDRKTQYIFMPNHLSFLDGPLLFMLIPQPVRVILKKEVFKIPLIGLGMKHVDFIPVDRRRMRSGKQSIERAARLMKEKGFSFLIFPEGTRSRDGNLQKFKRGGFFLALSTQVPVVPVTIKGSYELMPRGTLFPKKGTIKVIFHPPFPVQGFDMESMPVLMERVQNIIEEGGLRI